MADGLVSTSTSRTFQYQVRWLPGLVLRVSLLEHRCHRRCWLVVLLIPREQSTGTKIVLQTRTVMKAHLVRLLALVKTLVYSNNCHWCTASAPKPVYSQHKVRQSQQDRTLESMIPVPNPSHYTTPQTIDDSRDSEEQAAIPTERVSEIKQSSCSLSSVRKLRKSVEAGKHGRMFSFISVSTFVKLTTL